MNEKKPKDLAASVRQRLMNLARAGQEEFQYVLARYGMERLLYRLSQSSHGDKFVLKGAMLFRLWDNAPHRPTRDLDLLAKGAPSVNEFERIFREVFETQVEPDGLTFDAATIRGEQIKEEDEYQGIRIRGHIKLAKVRIPLQVDIGFGDAVTPNPLQIAYPVLLDFPPPTMLAYNRETVVAEKFQAMVLLGIANSRMKDFFDIWSLAMNFDFDGILLSNSIVATFARRRTDLPSNVPLALSAEFADQSKLTQWKAFIRKGDLADRDVSLPNVLDLLQTFLMPIVEASRGDQFLPSRWPARGPWPLG